MILKENDIVLKRYRIEKSIGEGGFGEVFLATHLELNVFRAIKVLHRDAPGITDNYYRHKENQFRREAQIGAKIDHPQIIRVFDFASDNGTLILVMEYAPNGDLAKFLKEYSQQNRFIPIDSSLKILREISSGLAALHDLNGVHRDLKPSNILFDKERNAKIGDLGIVQTSESNENKFFGHPGTPAYMSPEQRVSNEKLTPASDVYSLGLIAFELLTLKNKQLLPDGVNICQLRQEVDPWLENAINTMMQEDPQKRPQNGQEVIEILTPTPTKHIDPHQKENYIEIPLTYGLSLQLVKITKGSFIMGTNDLRFDFTLSCFPSHEIYLPDFFIARYPISIAHFAAFIRSTGYVTTAERGGGGFINDYELHKFVKAKGATWAAPYGPEKVIFMKEKRPVTMVSWQDATVFCQWLESITNIEFRIPSEAEWEKAARGTDGRIWPWGNNPPTKTLCNFYSQEIDITPSDKYSPSGDSPYGCADMNGNIWEWTNSRPEKYPYNPDDGREMQFPQSDRVLRGGSIIHFPSNVHRDKDPESACYFNDGFRVVASKIK